MFVANSSWNIVNFRSDLIKALISKGFNVQVLSPNDNYSHLIPKLGCDYIKIDLNARGLNIIEEFKVFFQLWYYIKILKPDMVLSFTIKPNIYCGFISRFYDVPVLCNVTGLGSTFTNHSRQNYFINALYKLALKKIKICFFQNYEDMQYFLTKKFIAKHQAYFVPGSGVNIQLFKKKNKTIKPNKKFVFTFVGRILKEKGIGELVKAGRGLAQDNSVKIIIAGKFEKTKLPTDLCLQFEDAVRDHVFDHVGFVENITDILNETDCLVLPSYREGSSRAILEAMSMRIPVITNDVPGCNNLVKDGVTGFLTKSMNHICLEKNMQKMLRLTSEERRIMGNNGRKKVVAEFQIKKVVKVYIDIINKFNLKE